MPLQDLTPQLRTRLNRMERLVGWFVFFATALLLFGFGYYLYNKARTSGWFLVKARFYTYVNNAAGLTVGAPVMLMGFQVGQISGITAMPPRSKYNVRIEFFVNQVTPQKDPYYGYIWSEGSLVKVNSDLLGNRSLEITRGTNGCNAYLTHPLETLSLDEAKELSDPQDWRLAENLYDDNSNLVFRVYTTALWPSNVEQMAEMKLDSIPAINLKQNRSHITAMWNKQLQRYEHYNPRDNGETNAYQLVVAESPSVTDQAQAMITQVQKALPGILALTNKIAGVLDNANATLANAALATSNLNQTIVSAQPMLTNFTAISAQLREPGGMVNWAIGTNGNEQLQGILTNANSMLANTDTNLTAILVHLADLTSNLNVQVQTNTNMLSSISKIVVDTDDFIQGLKRHWLLRSAFKQENTPSNTNAPPPDLRPPRQRQAG
ncbi:MAG TPA: MlaD family protein [Verrucomicrobiae bacterium]|nr:MlaD family protein [Verrucomicrobiae bacterium]